MPSERYEMKQSTGAATNFANGQSDNQNYHYQRRNTGITEFEADKSIPIAIIEDEKEEIDARMQEDFEDVEQPTDSKCFATVQKVTVNTQRLLNSKILKYSFMGLLALAYAVYLGFCIAHFIRTKDTATGADYEGNIRLFWMSASVFVIVVIRTVYGHFNDELNEFFNKISTKFLELVKAKIGNRLRIIWMLFQLIVVFIIVIWAGITAPENLISIGGLVALLLIALLCCRNIAMINWQSVIGGVMLQLLFALIVLRTDAGFTVFNFMGDRVAEFLLHCDAGAGFVFGAAFREHFFAFSVLSVVVYFSAVISILFHLGILPFVIEKAGFFMKFVMGTGAAESIVAAANIFVGQSEAPLIVAPYLKAMTNSEIHSIMTSGFATIAGGLLAAYVGMGVSAKHLLGASVMSAPAALAISKLIYPETKIPIIVASKIRKIKLEKYSNIIEAAGAGAINSMKMIAAIAVNLIAFISILAFMNSTLTWFGHRVGLDQDLTFELLTSYLLWPLSYVMGVPSVDCRAVAQLIGIKTFINEFVAYEKYGKMAANLGNFMNLTQNGTVPYEWIGTDIFIPSLNATIIGGTVIEEKSRVIATYSLCGFSNFGSLGVSIGALSAIAPMRRRDIVSCVITAMIGGNIACFMTACIAGLLFQQ